MNKVILIFAAVLGFVLVCACSPEPPALINPDAPTDTGNPTDDADDVESTVEDTEEAPEPGGVAYFIIEEMDMDQSIGCDLNGDGNVDNAMGKLLAQMPAGVGGGEDEGEDEGSMGGASMVFALDGVSDFENEDDFELLIYGVEFDDPRNPPDDLFSGSCEITLGDKQSEFDGASIEDGRVSTPEGTLDFAIPMGEDPMSLEMLRGQLFADIDGPDGELLNGELTSGIMCGAIDKDIMASMIAESIGGAMGGMIEGFIKGAADVECNGIPKQCLSVGMGFSAVSVQVR